MENGRATGRAYGREMRGPVHIRRTLAITVAMCSTLPLSGQVDPVRAEAYFKEAKAFCDRDSGRLWGVSLYGPMVIADAATSTIATNQPAPEGARPRNLGFANATTQWGGVEWSTFCLATPGVVRQVVSRHFNDARAFSPRGAPSGIDDQRWTE